jgi:hypothetical protein
MAFFRDKIKLPSQLMLGQEIKSCGATRLGEKSPT